MADRLPDDLFKQTQIGQILLQGGGIPKEDAQRVEDVAAAQAKQPPGERKLIGQMFVEAGLCSKQDVDAAFDVQKGVRAELSEMLKQGEAVKPDDIQRLIESGYQKYEKQHPDYHRPNEPEQQLEIPPAMHGEAPRPLDNRHGTMLGLAEESLANALNRGGRKPEELERSQMEPPPLR